MANEKETDVLNQEDTFFDGLDIEPADGSSEELSDINLDDFLASNFLEASDNVEMPSLDVFSEITDTSELDAMLEAENNSDVDDGNMIDLNNLDFEGLDLDSLNIDDIDLDNISLEDLMTDDSVVLDESESDTEGVGLDEIADMMSMLNVQDTPEPEPQVTSDAVTEPEHVTEPEPVAGTEPEEEISYTEIVEPEEEIDLDKLLDNETAEEISEEAVEEEQVLHNSEYTTDGRENVKKKGNVFSEALSVLSSEQDEEDEAEVPVEEVEALLDNVRAASTKKKKKKLGFRNLFANIVDDKEIEKSENRKKKELELEQQKVEKEEKKKLAQEEKAKKKEQQKLDKERLKEEKKEAKELKKQAKKEAKELRELEEETEIEGRINKVGAIIVFVVIGMMAVFIFAGTRMFSYSNSISNAKTYYDKGQYVESYNELAGLDLNEQDEVLYQKVVTIMYVYRQLDAYETYYKEERYPQALDSLLKGIREYEKYMPDAIELEITDDMDKIKNDIVTELSTEYGITEDMAREINQITDSTEYSKRVYDLAQNLASNYLGRRELSY